MKASLIFYVVLSISLIFILTGCTMPTSVIFNVNDGNLKIWGFGRGQTILGMQCIACPHVGAKIEIRTLNNESICSGSNEVIVSDTQKLSFKVKCAGLELYEGKTVKIIGEGFTGGGIGGIREFKFDEERVVEFEKV